MKSRLFCQRVKRRFDLDPQKAPRKKFWYWRLPKKKQEQLTLKELKEKTAEQLKSLQNKEATLHL
jgi:hypothetical protein